MILPGLLPSALASALRKNQLVTCCVPWLLSSRQKKWSWSESFANSAMTVPEAGIARSSSEHSPVVVDQKVKVISNCQPTVLLDVGICVFDV